MSGMKRNVVLAMAVAAAVVTPAAFATNGYFQHGYGVKSQGMGGAGVAYAQDSLAAATNPAGMALIGDRMDVGVTWFRPIREGEIAGSVAPVNGSYDANDKKDFFIPEFGYNKMMNNNMSLGVSVYGNGGMNTSYTTPIPLFSGTNSAGVDLSQLFISPTLAFKLTPEHSVGIAINFAYQKFKATGLQNFDNPLFSSSPGDVTDNGYDTSTGWGARIGWTGQISQAVTLGATYQTKTSMGEFDKYKGLFAEQGKFDIPSNYAVGIAIKATPKTVVAFDIEEIKYTDSAAVSNKIDPLLSGVQLGSDNGPGFGWEDMTVYKLGISHEMSNDLTVRAGWNHGKQPIPSSQTLFNMLAPGVVEDHLTLGATWKLAKDSEISGMYMHAFKNTVHGSGSIPPGFGGGEADLTMYQDSLGIAWGKKW
jgi:long-chain fatty acid transport protein